MCIRDRSEEDVKEIEAAKEELATAAQSDDKDKIEAALQTFQQKAQKLGQAVYEASQAEGGAQPGAGPEATAGGEASDDEPVDADFEVKS